MFLNVSKAFINHYTPLFGWSVGLSVCLAITNLFKGCFSQFKDILPVFECFFFVIHTPLKAPFWSVHLSVCPLVH